MTAKTEIARISTKGQVVIPKAFRDVLKLEPGTPMAVDISGGMLVMKPVRSPIKKKDRKVLEEINEAWKEIERGESRKAKTKGFLKEIKDW